MAGFRQRTSDTSKPYTARVWNYNLSNNTYIPQPRFGEARSMNDFVTPNFRKRSSGGEVIINPMTSSYRSVLYSGSGYTVNLYGNPATWETCTFRPGLLGWGESNSHPQCVLNEVVTTSDMAHVSREAATRCLSSIGRSNSNTWENLAEAKKTIQLLRHPIAAWHEWNRKTPLVSAGSSSANAYLLYRYGISPLVRDVNEIMTQAFRNVRPRWSTTHAQSEMSRQSITTHTSTGTHTWVYRKQKTETFVVRCTSIDEPISDWAYTYGLSRKQLLTLWWELIPYSFVADWLVNTGDVIGALANAFEPQSLGRCESHKWVLSDVRTFLSHTIASPHTLPVPMSGYIRVDQILKARYLGFLTGPGLVIKSNFRLDDATRVADAFALIAQQVLRRGRAIEMLYR